jgi:acyl-CoA thioesterase
VGAGGLDEQGAVDVEEQEHVVILSDAVGLDSDIALHDAGPGAWDTTIPGHWEVVRGPLGGFVAALVLHGLTRAVDDPARPPRSLTVHFLRPPAPGPARLTATVERAGRGLSTVSARLEQDGRPAALALAAFGGPYPGPAYDEAPMPPVDPPDPDRVAPAAAATFTPPPFTRNLTLQQRFGALPFTGADRAEVGGWTGLLEPRPLDALSVALFADAWFPAPFPRATSPSVAPTIDYTVHFRGAIPPGTDGLVLARFTSRVARDGYFEEDGEVWLPDGTLVAQSRQLALLLG